MAFNLQRSMHQRELGTSDLLGVALSTSSTAPPRRLVARMTQATTHRSTFFSATTPRARTRRLIAPACPIVWIGNASPDSLSGKKILGSYLFCMHKNPILCVKCLCKTEIVRLKIKTRRLLKNNIFNKFFDEPSTIYRFHKNVIIVWVNLCQKFLVFGKTEA